MNLKFWEQKKSIYDEPIERVLEELREQDPTSDEFRSAIAHLNKLTELKASTRWKMKVSPDTLAIVVGNLIGIGIIVMYEERHAMTSKGMNFVKPPSYPKP